MRVFGGDQRAYVWVMGLSTREHRGHQAAAGGRRLRSSGYIIKHGGHVVHLNESVGGGCLIQSTRPQGEALG